MKLSQFILTILVAAGVGFVSAQYFAPSNSVEVSSQKKSVYDRVVNSGKIRCGYAIWPPYMLKDPNTGALSGINFDTMEVMGKLLGVEIEWSEETSWGTAIEGLNTDRYDVFCATVWPDGVRSKQATQSIPAFYSAIYGYTREGDTRFDGNIQRANQDDITISSLEGDMTHSISITEFPEAKHLVNPQLNDGSTLIQDVITKKADIIFVDEGVVSDFHANNKDRLRKVKDIDPIRVFGEVYAVKKGEFQLKNMIDTTLTTMINSGSIDRLVRKYDNSYFLPQRNYQTK